MKKTKLEMVDDSLMRLADKLNRQALRKRAKPVERKRSKIDRGPRREA